MTPIDWLNLTSSGASLILAIVAVFLGIYFYTQSKNTETNVKETLASIKAQTDALQKLTGRWMDRLTRYATEGNPANENMVHVLAAIHNLPSTLIRTIQTPSQQEIESLTTEAISCYIVLFYYCALTNIFSQSNLPPIAEFDDKNNYHILVKNIIEQSFADVEFMKQVLHRIHKDVLEKNYYYHLYIQVNDCYLQYVKDPVATFASKT